jgi:hypothetical protein
MRVIKSPPLAFDPDQTGDLNKDLNKGLVKRLIENPDLNGFRST